MAGFSQVAGRCSEMGAAQYTTGVALREMLRVGPAARIYQHKQPLMPADVAFTLLEAAVATSPCSLQAMISKRLLILGAQLGPPWA